jgi:hypothetical protein
MANHAVPGLYETPGLRARILDQIREENFAWVIDNLYSPVLGKDPHGPSDHTGRTCDGGQFRVTRDEFGGRVCPGYDPAEVRVVMGGDSWVYGSEVNDAETMAANLAVLLGEPVANYGAAGYGVLQAYLRLAEKIENHPKAEVAVLGVLRNDFERTFSGHIGVYFESAEVWFGLKPRMHDGRIVPLDTGDFASAKHYREAVGLAFERDFWSKPKRGFPYGWRFFRAIGSNSARFKEMNFSRVGIGPPRQIAVLTDERIGGQVREVLNLFSDWATEHRLLPVVYFFQANRTVPHFLEVFLEAHGEGLDPNLHLFKFDPDPFPSRHIISCENPRCHPDAQGQAMLALELFRQAFAR